MKKFNGFGGYFSISTGNLSQDRNRMRIETFFDRHPLKTKETEARVDRISRYPDSFLCR
jgi:hypothetical protein